MYLYIFNLQRKFYFESHIIFEKVQYKVRVPNNYNLSNTKKNCNFVYSKDN